MPGSDERKIVKALGSHADGVIADLEDAVVPGEKAAARDLLRRVYAEPSERLTRFVRVNGVDSPFFEEDVALLAELRLETAVVLPKATPEAAAALAPAGLPILAIAETAVGVRLAYEIARRRASSH